jgi:hypothetical protein
VVLGLAAVLASVGFAVAPGCNYRRGYGCEFNCPDEDEDAAVSTDAAEAAELFAPRETVFDAAPPLVRCGFSDDAGDAADLDAPTDPDGGETGDANAACSAPGALCAGPKTLVRFGDGVCIDAFCRFPTSLVDCYSCSGDRCRDPIQE